MFFSGTKFGWEWWVWLKGSRYEIVFLHLQGRLRTQQQKQVWVFFITQVSATIGGQVAVQGNLWDGLLFSVLNQTAH